MLARLGAVVAEVADVVEADLVLKFGIRYFGIDAGLDLGIEVVAVPVPDVKEPGHVVDAGDELLAAIELVLHADGSQQILGADLDAVAEADRPNAGVALHVAREHRHGIGVIEEQGVRAYLFHVPGKILHHRDRPKGPHDAADAQRVGDGLAQAVFFRDLEVDDRGGVVASDLDRVDDEGRAAKRRFSVLDAKIALDPAVSAKDFPHSFEDRPALLEPFTVNIVQSELAVAQGFTAHAVADDVPGKYSASRPHKCDLHQLFLPFSFGILMPPF